MGRVSSFCVFLVCVMCFKIEVFLIGAQNQCAFLVVMADFEIENKKFVGFMRPAENFTSYSFGVPEETPSLSSAHFYYLKQGEELLIKLNYRYGSAEAGEVVKSILITNFLSLKIRNKAEVAAFSMLS